MIVINSITDYFCSNNKTIKIMSLKILFLIVFETYLLFINTIRVHTFNNHQTEQRIVDQFGW